MPLAQRTRNDHYLSQAYLRRWAADGNRVFAYRTLVEHESVPVWTHRPVRGVAYQRDLYSAFVSGSESDDFERWVTTEFEEPGLGAIEKLLEGSRLTRLEWEQLGRFVALQDIRTPLSLRESLSRWQTEIPALVERTIQQSIRSLEADPRGGPSVRPSSRLETNAFADALEVRIVPGEFGQPGTIEAEVLVGRRLWLPSMRHLLTGAARAVASLKWCLVKPAEGCLWFTTDQPVLRLNY